MLIIQSPRTWLSNTFHIQRDTIPSNSISCVRCCSLLGFLLGSCLRLLFRWLCSLFWKPKRIQRLMLLRLWLLLVLFLLGTGWFELGWGLGLRLGLLLGLLRGSALVLGSSFLSSATMPFCTSITTNAVLLKSSLKSTMPISNSKGQKWLICIFYFSISQLLIIQSRFLRRKCRRFADRNCENSFGFWYVTVWEIWLICFFCGLPCLRREGAREKGRLQCCFRGERGTLLWVYDS